MKRELKQRERLWQEATGHCVYCGHPVSPEEMETDHIVPRSRGGENGFANKVCSCPRCNALKGDTSLEEFLRNTMGPCQRERYLNRLDALVEQGKMSWDKAVRLSGREEEAPVPEYRELFLVGGLVYIW
jgi:CRISPR/Cas system Type II protein with McrA/HNH and RuvC-like nuclease domain